MVICLKFPGLNLSFLLREIQPQCVYGSLRLPEAEIEASVCVDSMSLTFTSNNISKFGCTHGPYVCICILLLHVCMSSIISSPRYLIPSAVHARWYSLS